MVFNFRKISAVLTSIAMIGASVGVAAAANYPAPFVSAGSANVAIVYGTGSGVNALDSIQAGYILSDLQSKMGSTSEGSSTSVSGGEAVNLATSSQKLYFNSALNSAKTSITKNDLPTILEDGSVLDDAGTSYTYTQSITLGDRNITYGTSGNDFSDPEIIIDGDILATNYLYQYSLTFNKNVNVTSADVQGNEISVFGKKFTIGANSQVDAETKTLYLYGSGETVTLKEGEEQTVSVGGTEYTIKVVGITQESSTDKVSVTVDGSTVREIGEGSSSKVGGLEVYAKTVFYSAKETSENYATLNIGTEKLKFVDGQTVYTGSDETSVQGTSASISSSGDKLSQIQISIAMNDATKDYIKAGGDFVDPIFGGLKLSFAAVIPTLDSTSRESIVIDSDNSRNARVTFTSALADESKLFTFLHDQDTADSTITPILADTANNTIHVVEGESVELNDYMVVNSGDYGRIIKLTSIPTGALQSTSTIQFQDALTGENIFSGSGLTVGITGNATTSIDGQTYYFTVANGTGAVASPSSVKITWGTTSSYDGNTGAATSIYPRIKTKNGGWISILAPVALTDGTTYSLPGTETLTSYEAGNAFVAADRGKDGEGALGSSHTGSWKIGNINWTLTGDFNATTTVVGIDTDNDEVANCNFNSTYGGAILFIEEKKTTETNNADNGDIICVYADTSGSTTPVEVSVSSPVATGTGTSTWSGLQTWESDSYTQSAVTRYGTYIKYNSQDNDKVEIYYPNEQLYADVLLATEGATVTGGEAGSSTVTPLGEVLVKDTEVSSVSSRNLIVVGGSCINSVAANLLDGAHCTSAFTEKTGIGSGQYVIESFGDAYATGKIALLVAGYEAQDTVNAATYLRTKTVDTTAGTKYIGTSATSAEKQ
jgi:hypothetical protein